MLCERCHDPISWITIKKRGNREYYYAVHYYGTKNGKKIQKECYLGPVGKYIHAETINRLGLTNAKETDRFYHYLDEIVKEYLVKDHFNVEKAIEILDKVLDLADKKIEDPEKKQILLDRLNQWIDRLKENA